eukprot:92857-Rhodomonas_salina.2
MGGGLSRTQQIEKEFHVCVLPPSSRVPSTALSVTGASNSRTAGMDRPGTIHYNVCRSSDEDESEEEGAVPELVFFALLDLSCAFATSAPGFACRVRRPIANPIGIMSELT